MSLFYRTGREAQGLAEGVMRLAQCHAGDRGGNSTRVSLYSVLYSPDKWSPACVSRVNVAFQTCLCSSEAVSPALWINRHNMMTTGSMLLDQTGRKVLCLFLNSVGWRCLEKSLRSTCELLCFSPISGELPVPTLGEQSTRVLLRQFRDVQTSRLLYRWHVGCTAADPFLLEIELL